MLLNFQTYQVCSLSLHSLPGGVFIVNAVLWKSSIRQVALQEREMKCLRSSKALLGQQRGVGAQGEVFEIFTRFSYFCYTGQNIT